MTSTPIALGSFPTLGRRIDVASSAGKSIVATILLIAAVNLTTFDFTPELVNQEYTTDWQTTMRLATCGVFALYGCAHLSSTMKQFGRFPAAWATLFGLWALMTIPTSESPLFSTAAVFALASVMLFAPAVLVQLGGQRTVETLLKGLLLFVCVNWFLYFAVPDLGRSMFDLADGEIIYRFGNDAQQLGLQIAWALGFLLTLTLARLRSWRSAVIPFVVLAVTLPLTQSRTAFLASATAVGVVLWQYMRGWQRLLAVFAAAILAAGALAIVTTGGVTLDADGLARAVSRSGESEEIENFTGRDVLWQHALEKIWESPIVGWGYGCSRFVMDDPKFSFQPNHAHNLFLNVALCMGIPGALLLLAMLGHQLIDAVRRPSIVPTIAVALLLVAGITEPLVFGPMPRSHTVILLITLFWRQTGERDLATPETESEEV
jgi:exopolysaccharide production protein ExoQ